MAAFGVQGAIAFYFPDPLFWTFWEWAELPAAKRGSVLCETSVRKMRTTCLAGPIVTGQGVMVLKYKKEDLDWIEGKRYLQ